MINTKLFAAIMLITIAFTACNQASKESQSKFVLNGTLEGITKGKIVLINFSDMNSKQDTAVIENGKFTFSGNFAEPTAVFLSLKRGNITTMLPIYAENATMTLTGHADKFGEVEILGGKFQEEVNKFEKEKAEALNGLNHAKIIKVLSDPIASKKSKDEANKELLKLVKEFENKFIKENSASHYTVELVMRSFNSGQGVEEIEAMLNGLDVSLATYPKVVKMRKKVEVMKNTEVSFDKFVKEASNVTYKVDKRFNGKKLSGIVYLGIFKNNNICALKKDGTVQIINSNGEVISSFKAKIDGKPSSIAVDKTDNIYVMSTKQEKKVTKVRGKKVTRMVPKGVEYTIFNKKGQQQNKFELSGLVTATGARVVDNKLMVSDCINRLIGIFDAKTGKMSSKIENMRPCCGILDFSVNDKKEILVANLGAFRVQGFDFTGKQLLTFGKRGTYVNDFQGCCNPVSVAYLSNGAIVTVEKDPTRIKIYSKEGAKQIGGIEELVKGCMYIPMIVDSKDNLYLASGEKGMVKCVLAE